MSAAAGTVDSQVETAKITDDDEECLIEPRFKYQRVVHDVATRLEQDSASCAVVHDKFICVGFSSGRIAFFDSPGARALREEGPIASLLGLPLGHGRGRQLRDLLCERQEDLHPGLRPLGVESNAGRLPGRQVRRVGRRLLPPELQPGLPHRRAVLDAPRAGIPGQKEDGVVPRTGAGRAHPDVHVEALADRLHERHGHADLRLQTEANDLPHPAGQTPEIIPVSRFPPRHCWIDSTTLIVAWGSTISICCVNSHMKDANGLPLKKASAQLMLIKAVSMTQYSVTSEDTIGMRHADIRLLKRFFLCSLPSDSLYFLLGSRELIEASAHPCLIDDRVAWFLENKLYKEALDEIGRRLVHTLVDQGEFADAASNLTQICGRHKEEWEYYCELFEKYGEILKLVPYIPAGSPQLEPECYEWMLTAALYSRPRLFRKLIHEWNPDIYRAASIIDKILKRMADSRETSLKNSASNNKDVNLLQSLAHLLAYVRNYERALDIYILLKDKAIFGVIDRYHLFNLVKDRIVELMEISSDLAVRLLLDNEDSIPSKQVVVQLSKTPKLQMAYLNRLYSRGEANEHADLMIRLYAEYDRPKLLPFLKKCEIYKLEKALDICKRRGYTQEVIYLLGRSGDRLKALDMYMTHLGDIDGAIVFCTEHEYDVELWDRLIELSFQKPEHIKKLLLKVVAYVDPLVVIQKIPPDVEIPGLQEALLKILRDYELQIGLLKDSKKSAAESTFVDVTRVCDVCRHPIIGAGDEAGTPLGELLLLGCGHLLHRSCAPSDSPAIAAGVVAKKNGELPSLASQANLNPFLDY
ncbi:RING-type domain-containing protein [Aphelenchoides fujianensis]|nr:RING-type domain-containing protein [Aphelenchoides fujianensis]